VTTEAPPTGILLMTYGSAATAEDVPEFMLSVRRGGPAHDELVAEFERRYRLIGFSPLVRITQAQGQALQELLDRESGRGAYRVEVGMLHSEPSIATAMRRLAAGDVSRMVGIVMSPQWSPLIMGGYTAAVDAARGVLTDDCEVRVAGPWHMQDGFLDALAEKVTDALAGFPADRRERVAVLLTVHSLPKPVVDREPEYLRQLMETVGEVVRRAGLREGQWQFAYQSAGHSPEEWLKPDLKDLLPGIREAGAEDVLVVPVQFLADHLEILYDIDVAAREEAEREGLRFHRIELLNTSPRFIRALADVVAREEAATVATSDA
jgi:ferrochelatase